MAGFVFHCFSLASLPQLEEALSRAGFQRHVVDGAAIIGEASFLQAFAAAVPYRRYVPGDLDAPIDWNAFRDCLWGGLKAQAAERVAIVWLHAERMFEDHLPLLLQFVEVVTSESRNLLRPASLEVGQDRPILLRVYLIGDDPRFPGTAGRAWVGTC